MKAIISVARLGIRMLPSTIAIYKETLASEDKLLIQSVVNKVVVANQ